MGKNPEPKVDKVRAKAEEMDDGLEKEMKEKIRMKRQRRKKYTAGAIR